MEAILLSQVTLPWFYAHWILIGSLSRVLLAELFSGSDSPGGSRHRQRLADQERQIFGAETERQRLRYQITKDGQNMSTRIINQLNRVLILH